GRYVNASVEAGAFNTFQLQASAGLGNGADYASAGFHMLTTDGYDVSPDQSAAGVPAVGVRGEAGDKEGDRIATVYLRGGRTLSPALRVDGIARNVNKRSELDGQAFSAPIPGRAYDDASTVSNRQAQFGASATLNLLDDRWTTVLSAAHLDERRRDETT